MLFLLNNRQSVHSLMYSLSFTPHDNAARAETMVAWILLRKWLGVGESKCMVTKLARDRATSFLLEAKLLVEYAVTRCADLKTQFSRADVELKE